MNNESIRKLTDEELMETVGGYGSLGVDGLEDKYVYRALYAIGTNPPIYTVKYGVNPYPILKYGVMPLYGITPYYGI